MEGSVSYEDLRNIVAHFSRPDIREGIEDTDADAITRGS